MRFKTHSDINGSHAFLSPSKYHWVNYTVDKLVGTYNRTFSVALGTRLHNIANELIKLGIKLPKIANSLNQFVNDAIGLRMSSEQVLFYSYNCYGTADAISFKSKKLRIHDLKTGRSKPSMIQLEIYAALFCLEYDYQPSKIEIELRIYQMGKILFHFPEAMAIKEIMDKIVLFDKTIKDVDATEETWANL